MRNALPEYYSSLAPFRNALNSGRGVLMYHHVGPRPRAARIKGLYVGTELFKRQIAELSNAAFSTPAYNGVLTNCGAGPEVFLSFDDGFCDVFHNAFPVLTQHGFRAIQFVVADLFGKTSEWQIPSGDVPGPLMDGAQIKEWLAAGNEIGSHTLTHPRLTQIPVAQAREEITASKKKLEDQFGRKIHHFCYPYGDYNPAVRELVREAGYRTACTTEFGVNVAGTSPFALKRITARYKSRSLKTGFGLFG